MTTQSTTAALAGWRGPFFPAPLSRINAAYETKMPGQTSIASVIRKAGLPCLDCGAEHTADGYGWFRGVQVYDKALLTLLFPWARNGKKLDRSVALYLTTVSPDMTADDPLVTEALDRIATALEALPEPKHYTGR